MYRKILDSSTGGVVTVRVRKGALETKPTARDNVTRKVDTVPGYSLQDRNAVSLKSSDLG